MHDVYLEDVGFVKKAFYHPELAKVLRVDREHSDAVLKLELPGGRPLGHEPGQFIQVSVFGYGEIPISICSSPTRSDSFELCVRPVGHVSRAIHSLSAGDWIGVRGPYGRGFPVEGMKDQNILIIAGGIGIAPLRSLIDYVRDRREDYRRLIIVYGARNPSLILFQNDLKTWSEDPSVELMVTVDQPDDSWKGRTGVITGPLREMNIDPESTFAAVVGPPVMYRFAAMELLKKGMREDFIYFSLERRFKCGIGKCGHCQLNDLYVCQDGPVFLYSELLGRTEAIEAWAPEKNED